MAEEHKEDHGGEKHGESHGGGGHGGGGHGGGHEEAHEGAPEWLISFADNVALLMGFFVILLAMNMAKPSTGGIGGEAEMGGAPEDAMMEFVLSVREAFHNSPEVNSRNPDDQALIRYMLKRIDGEANQDGPAGDHKNLQAMPNGTVVRITATIPFDDRAAVLSGAARETIQQTAASLRDQRWVIEVRGHVSPYEVMHNPIRARELSYERGIAVATALVESGLKWGSLRVAACGDAQRVVARASDRDEDRTNQRVEIVVTTELLPDDPYTKPGGAAGQNTDRTAEAESGG